MNVFYVLCKEEDKSLRTILLSYHFLYLLHVVCQHFFNTALQCRTGRGTSRTCTHHLHPQCSRCFVKRYEFHITAIFLHVRSNSVCDDLFDKLDDFWIIGIDIVALYLIQNIHKDALSVKRGIFYSKWRLTILNIYGFSSSQSAFSSFATER